MYWFQKSNLLILQLCQWGVMAAMGLIAIVIPYEVFGRYVLGQMTVWSGELSTYGLVWATMMGAAVGLKRGYQVSMTYIIEKLPYKMARLFQGLGYAFMIFFLITMIYYGLEQTTINHRQTSPGMEIPMSLPYVALPLGFSAMLLISVEEFLLFLGVADRIDNKGL